MRFNVMITILQILQRYRLFFKNIFGDFLYVHVMYIFPSSIAAFFCQNRLDFLHFLLHNSDIGHHLRCNKTYICTTVFLLGAILNYQCLRDILLIKSFSSFFSYSLRFIHRYCHRLWMVFYVETLLVQVRPLIISRAAAVAL
jgi:hypothetical protein